MDIEEILKKMTLEDKTALCSGANFWETKKYEKYGIPSMFMCDGPHGLRKQEDTADMLGVNESRKATCFPAEVTTAASWDPELLEEIGSAIGGEAIDQGIGLMLGPGANLKRNPLCGRNFEYFSEDPYLAGKLAAGFIKGAEAKGVGMCLKHFAVNSQEYRRFTSDGIIDGRTLREMYLTAFETAVKEGRPSSVMCAYPKLNGTHCSDSEKLLTDILRTEWGFDGAVVTDWGAMNNRINGFRAGCDLNMPGGKVSVTVTNTGKYPGAEVVQLFIAPPAGGLHRPVRELKGFKKIFLNPSESKTVLFETDDRSFAVWNDGWQVPGGEYTVCVGGMSAVIEKSGEPIKAPEWQRGSWYESCAGKPNQKDWEAMLGRSYNPPVLKKGAFTMDNTVAEMRDYSLVMKIMYKATERVIAKGNGGKIDYEDPKFRMLMASSAESPLRSMQISGGMKGGLLPGMLEMANEHFLRGLRKMIKG